MDSGGDGNWPDRKAQRAAFLQSLDQSRRSSGLRVSPARPGQVEAWFLGPKGENGPLLRELIEDALTRHLAFRATHFPDDPLHVTDEIKASPGYQDACRELHDAANELFQGLEQSVPFSSLRYKGHMLWDQVLPAMVGYFGAMLYNQNNVAAEASPFTTQLEIAVGNDLCRMLGLSPPAETGDDSAADDRPAAASVTAWGHLTADGSIANIEGLWAARNVRYLGLAFREALQREAALAPARPIQVVLPDGRHVPLLDLDSWTALNLPLDTCLDLNRRVAAACRLDSAALTRLLTPYTVQNLGLLGFHRRFLPGMEPPVVIVPATAHYSWPKATTLLGLGSASLVHVPVDLRARMDATKLDGILQDCLKRSVPVISVVAVIGTTEESAIDPLDQVLALRERYRQDGLDFAIHADAAWGGYFASMLRAPVGAVGGAEPPQVPVARMSVHAERQFRLLPRVDAITVDPHKAGYVPYPAGALCYRNSALRDVVSLRAPVVWHSQSEPTVGIYGVEGSKPGASAAAVWLAHRVIGTDQRGYGRILGECLWNAKRLYARLATLDRAGLRLVPLQMLPSERDGKPAESVAAERRWLRDRVVEVTNAQLLATVRQDPCFAETFRDLGSDQVIVTFAFNQTDAAGTPQPCLARANALNQGIFQRCSQTRLDSSGVSPRLYLTSSSFDPADYGQPFVDAFCQRLGVTPVPGQAVDFLISTTMDPWATEVQRPGHEGPAGYFDFLGEIEKALVDAAEAAVDALQGKACADCNCGRGS